MYMISVWNSLSTDIAQHKERKKSTNNKSSQSPQNGGEEECIKDIDGKARRKETTRKTKTKVGGKY
jgi:hypothetical protein